jgi:hypothetical protein
VEHTEEEEVSTANGENAAGGIFQHFLDYRFWEVE